MVGQTDNCRHIIGVPTQGWLFAAIRKSNLRHTTHASVGSLTGQRRIRFVALNFRASGPSDRRYFSSETVVSTFFAVGV